MRASVLLSSENVIRMGILIGTFLEAVRFILEQVCLNQICKGFCAIADAAELAKILKWVIPLTAAVLAFTVWFSGTQVGIELAGKRCV